MMSKIHFKKDLLNRLHCIIEESNFDRIIDKPRHKFIKYLPFDVAIKISAISFLKTF